MSFSGLMQKTGLDKNLVEYIVYGSVIQEIKTANIAREAAITAGFNLSTPAHSVSMACISSNQAITSGMPIILRGKYFKYFDCLKNILSQLLA